MRDSLVFWTNPTILYIINAILLFKMDLVLNGFNYIKEKRVLSLGMLPEIFLIPFVETDYCFISVFVRYQIW